VTENPAPVTLAELTVTVPVPVDVSVTVWVAFVFTVRLPKAILAGLELRVGVCTGALRLIVKVFAVDPRVAVILAV
jgi:hypothetical protein